jgi:hypothetical protein
MKTKVIVLAVFVALHLNFPAAQTGELNLVMNYFNNYEVIKVTDIDLNDGTNNPDMFSYTLSYYPYDYTMTQECDPIQIVIEFKMTANVPHFGWEDDIIFFVKTNPFDFCGQVTIDAKMLTVDMRNIYYDDTGEELDISADEVEFLLTEGEANEMYSQLFAAQGNLPEGEYRFSFDAYTVDNSGVAPAKMYQVISITNPEYLELIQPGSSDPTDILEISELVPLFQWASNDFSWNENSYPECGVYIRVCEYDPIDKQHTSLQDALEDDPMVPFGEGSNFLRLDATPVGLDLMLAPKMFVYPDDAPPLEQGHNYVWQIIKKYPTTSGLVERESEIFVFRLADMGGGGMETGAGGSISASTANIYLTYIEQILGSEKYNELFGDGGSLMSYSPTGIITLNDIQQLTQDELRALADMFRLGERTITNIAVE